MQINKYKVAGKEFIKGNFGNAFKSLTNNNAASVIAQINSATWGNTGLSTGGKNWYFGANGIDYYFSFSSNQSVVDAYTKCSPLNAIINKKAQAYINGKSYILDKDGNEAKGKEVEAVKKLMKQPNPLQSENQFEAQAYIYCQLFGYCPILKIKPIGFTQDKDISQLWCIPPSMTNIEENPGLFYANYDKPFKTIILSYGGSQTELKVEDVFFLKDFTPSFNTAYLPESRIKCLAMEINNTIGAYESRNVLINYRGALGIISSDGKDSSGIVPMKDDEKSALQDDFLRYGLSRQQWKFIITTAMVRWQQIGIPTRELMLFEEIEDCIMRMCDVYGYQYELMSSTKGVTFANKNEAKKILYQDTIINEASSLSQQFTLLFGLDKLGFRIDKDYSHVPALQEDDLKNAQARKARNEAALIEFKNNIITYNRWRELNGENAIDGRDMFYYELLKDGFVFGDVPNQNNINIQTQQNAN